MWVPEYGRQFSEEHGLDHVWSSKDFNFIARRQGGELEDESGNRSGPVLVRDTDMLPTGVWHERYMRTRSESVEAMAAERRPLHYMLTGDGIPIVQDSLRDDEHYWRG
jgi:HTH-type transcriptional regulator, transcriptional repressor of NAD biosynthesis genes